MANKARLLSDVIDKAHTSDVVTEENSSLKDQMNAFKEILIHDITPKAFADVYAQTIAYGMFAARLHDTSLDSFSRQEAAELIPKSNPFLRKLFAYIAGPDLDDRIKWIVDDLVEIFLHSNVEELLKDFGKETKTEDPIIHFYETFLSEYDPKLRKARGVWYTPHPVVNFIVRAVDDILKTEFSLPKGLADKSKIKIKVEEHGKKIEQEVHKVQILDPATGTGTFLAEVIKHIYDRDFKSMQGIWSDYAENDLLPRLNGFELLMASYAMAHLKLDLLLKETGYKPKTDKRLRIYLTNSLEEYHKDTGTLFASWLSSEANEANRIKRDAPVMVIIGNPPYSKDSSNKGEWIMMLMQDYKKEPGGKEKLDERNSKWINADEIKFIRYGQYFVEQNGEGILAYINPHGFLDNPTFRGMRWNLLKTFDKIYTIDLHGNSNKKETCPDGTKDENVFDIMQGVCINLFIKTGKKKKDELGNVYHFDLYGNREQKYTFLIDNVIKTVPYKKLTNIAPNYFFVNKDYEEQSIYSKGFIVNEMFNNISTGYYTSCDDLVIANSEMELRKQINSYSQINIEYKLNLVYKTAYRPFDEKFIYYDSSLITRSRTKFIECFLGKENYILLTGKGTKAKFVNHFFISKIFSELKCAEYTTGSYMLPLYNYSTASSKSERTPNLNPEIVQKIADGLGLKFTNEKEADSGTFAPIDILDYIYAVLHSPTYREKYKEFLKIDFPRVPYPKDKETFWKLVRLGGELRQIHLLESPAVEKYITKYPADGDNVVNKIKYQDGKVYINDTQHFANVPEVAWFFFIGGYQPAQKWLKDRKGRKLEFDDILHYQKIIVALTETDRIMKEVDNIKLE
jgi:predicted helicase